MLPVTSYLDTLLYGVIVEPEERERLDKAIQFATEKHMGQIRKNFLKTPYIEHPIGVAKILIEQGVQDITTLVVAILHDTVEDSDTTFEELSQQFGDDVSDCVKELSDEMDEVTGEKKITDKSIRKEHEIEHSKHLSERAKLVKLADKIYNVLDLPFSWGRDRYEGYINFAHQIATNTLVFSKKNIILTKLDQKLRRVSILALQALHVKEHSEELFYFKSDKSTGLLFFQLSDSNYFDEATALYIEKKGYTILESGEKKSSTLFVTIE